MSRVFLSSLVVVMAGYPAAAGEPRAMVTAIDGGAWLDAGAPRSLDGGETSLVVVVTARSYSGNLGGLAGAQAKCAAEFTGAHLCSWREYDGGGSRTPIPASGAWMDGARYASRSPADPDAYAWSYCDGWRSSTAALSAWIDASGDFASSSTTRSCNTVRPLVCCRPAFSPK